MPVHERLLDAFARLLAGHLAPLPADAPADLRACFAELREHSTTYLKVTLTADERAELAVTLSSLAANISRLPPDHGAERLNDAQLDNLARWASNPGRPSIWADVGSAVAELQQRRKVVGVAGVAAAVLSHPASIAGLFARGLITEAERDRLMQDMHTPVLIGTGTTSDPRRYQCTKCKREFALMDHPGECNGSYTVTAPGIRTDGVNLSMTSDRDGVIEIAGPPPGEEVIVRSGATVTYVCHVTGGMVRVRLEDGREGVMHPNCFSGLR